MTASRTILKSSRVADTLVDVAKREGITHAQEAEHAADQAPGAPDDGTGG